MATFKGSDLYTFVTTTLLGFSMDSTYFYNLLNIAKEKIENKREWVVLRGLDTSQTASGSDTYLTSKVIPADFSRWMEENPITLLAANGVTYIPYYEIPAHKKVLYQNEYARFYVDYANLLLYLTGKVDQSYTIHQNYIKVTADITSANSWQLFPSRFHLILAFYVAGMYKLGADYDIVNAQGGENNKEEGAEILRAMFEWDDNLQRGMVKGINRFPVGSRPYQTGRINIDDV